MSANPCSPGSAVEDTAVQAARTLEWLRVAGAVKRFEQDGEGFIVEMPDRKLLALPAEAVEPFKRGVLVGYRLPRSPGVIA